MIIITGDLKTSLYSGKRTTEFLPYLSGEKQTGFVFIRPYLGVLQLPTLRKTDKHTETQTDIWVDRQTDSQTDSGSVND